MKPLFINLKFQAPFPLIKKKKKIKACLLAPANTAGPPHCAYWKSQLSTKYNHCHLTVENQEG